MKIIRRSPKRQLVPDGMIDGLGDRVMALARKHEEPGGSPNRNLREAYYDVWRLIAMAVRNECKDAVILCPDCDRIWLYTDGQEEGVVYRPETTKASLIGAENEKRDPRRGQGPRSFNVKP